MQTMGFVHFVVSIHALKLLLQLKLITLNKYVIQILLHLCNTFFINIFSCI